MEPATSPVLSVRVSQGECDLLEAAARQARTNLSDFVRGRAIDAAELEMLEHRTVTIAAEDWEKFEAWVAGPAKDVSSLRELAATHQP